MGKELKESNIEKLKEFISFAKEAVKEEKDEMVKTESFKIILNKMIEGGFTKSTEASKLNKNTQENHGSITKKQMELAQLCSISIEELNDIFRFKDEGVEIIAPIKGNDSLKRILASQCYLVASEICYSKEWVDSAELAECMRSMGVKDITNLSTQLKKLTEVFRTTGTRGHSKYKLTSGIGRKSAFNVINELAKGEKIEN